MPDLQNDTDRALVACSLWLDVGFIGAAALVVGLLQWVDGGSNWPWALVMAFCGGVLAAASWHRSEMVVERAERAPAVATDAPRELASRTYSSLIGRGAIAVLSSIPLQPNRTHDHDLRSPSPE